VVSQKELELLRQRKAALTLESALNRLTLQTEIHELRSATSHTAQAWRSPRRLVPMLVLVPAVAGLLFAVRRPLGPLPKRMLQLAKWAVPAYRIWKRFTAEQHRARNSKQSIAPAI
jgi:hypothetical protein